MGEGICFINKKLKIAVRPSVIRIVWTHGSRATVEHLLILIKKKKISPIAAVGY
jgi:hypothetical protein